MGSGTKLTIDQHTLCCKQCSSESLQRKQNFRTKQTRRDADTHLKLYVTSINQLALK